MELLGREQELAVLERLLDESGRGRGGALVLRGAPGVGLTSLLERAVGFASEGRVAQVVGVESELHLPFAAAHQLCVSMLERLDELPEPQRDALASAFGRIECRSPDPLLVGLAVHTLLSNAANQQPLLCAIDDAQWLDQASFEALAFVARRASAESIALIFAVHEPTATRRTFGGIPELRIGGLSQAEARELLGSAVPGPLDGGVRDRLVAESGGNPLALLELPAQLTPDELAGLSVLPEPLPVGDRLGQSLVSLVRDLPAETRTLLLLAAAEPEGRPSLFWSAAASLGLSADAAGPAEAEGLIHLGQRVAFRQPLIRSAIYGGAPVAERQRVHRALVDVIDPVVDPDRRAWHRAAASLAPDDDVAVELEASANRAKGRGDNGAATALLERAAALTPEAKRRFGRTLAAAQSALAAGSPGRAAALLSEAHLQPSDDLERAQAARLRAAIGLARGEGADRATTLLRAAQALEPLDLGLARDAHLEALEAAIYTGRLGSDRVLLETAEGACSAPAAPIAEVDAGDLLLDGLALLLVKGHAAAVPVLRRAIGLLRSTDESRWLALGSLAALELWDDEGLHDLTTRHLQLAHGPGGPTGDSPALDELRHLDDVLAGRFGTATAPFAEARESSGSAWDQCDPRLISPGELIAAAWRGRPDEARDLAEACIREAFARDLGRYVSVGRYAIALLEIGLGRYEAALGAARAVCDGSAVSVVTSALPELVEAAARTGNRDLAVSAVRRLSERTLPSGTDWAVGTLARSRALLEEGAGADRLYQEAIERLQRTRAAAHLARAHLVYGEWLRRERRRREAREQLRTARDMFIFMGAQAFGERARGELTATGERTPRRVDEPASSLTPQEERIAHLVGDGASNAEIAAQMFISPRTVEYHLHKVFRKLDVSSRTQLARALLASGGESAAPGSE